VQLATSEKSAGLAVVKPPGAGALELGAGALALEDAVELLDVAEPDAVCEGAADAEVAGALGATDAEATALGLTEGAALVAIGALVLARADWVAEGSPGAVDAIDAALEAPGAVVAPAVAEVPGVTASSVPVPHATATNAGAESRCFRASRRGIALGATLKTGLSDMFAHSPVPGLPWRRCIYLLSGLTYSI
jgi:hypothetical protein